MALICVVTGDIGAAFAACASWNELRCILHGGLLWMFARSEYCRPTYGLGFRCLHHSRHLQKGLEKKRPRDSVVSSIIAFLSARLIDIQIWLQRHRGARAVLSSAQIPSEPIRLWKQDFSLVSLLSLSSAHHLLFLIIPIRVGIGIRVALASTVVSRRAVPVQLGSDGGIVVVIVLVARPSGPWLGLSLFLVEVQRIGLDLGDVLGHLVGGVGGGDVEAVDDVVLVVGGRGEADGAGDVLLALAADGAALHDGVIEHGGAGVVEGEDDLVRVLGVVGQLLLLGRLVGAYAVEVEDAGAVPLLLVIVVVAATAA